MSAAGAQLLLAGSTQQPSTATVINKLVQWGTRLYLTDLHSRQQDSCTLEHELPGSSGQHILVCIASQHGAFIAFSSSGSPDRLKVVNATALSEKPIVLQQERAACSCVYSSAAFSPDGNCVAALCGPAQPYIEYWQLSPLQLLHSTTLQPGQHGHNLTFFPGSSSVVCSMGITAATVICFDKVLGTYIARQASIKGPAWKDAAILLAGEQVNESLTCQCWMPNGDLLFGTSTGRILRAEGVLPDKARPGPLWGLAPLLQVKQLLSDEELNTVGSSILQLQLTAHCLLMIAASSSAHKSAVAIWLDAAELHAVATAALPAGVYHAWCAIGGSQLSLCCCNGDVYIMDTSVKDAAASLKLVSRQHVQPITRLHFLPSERLISISSDGCVGIWTLKRKDEQMTALQLEAMQSIHMMVTSTAAASNGSYMLLGTATGQILLLSTSSLQELVEKELTSLQDEVAQPPNTPSQSVSTSIIEAQLDLQPNAGTSDTSQSTQGSPVVSAEAVVFSLPEQHSSAVTALALSSTGTLLASLSALDSTLILWEACTEPHKSWTMLTKQSVEEAVCMAWMPDTPQQGPPRLLVGTKAGQLLIVSCTKQDVGASAWSTTPCWKLQSTPLSLLPAAAYAPGSSNGSLVVYAALQDKSVHKYRLNLQALLTLKPKVCPLLSPEQGFPMQKPCTALLLDALGRLLAASSDGCCYVLDPETMQRISRLVLQPSQTGGIAALACNTEGLLATGCHTGTISLASSRTKGPAAAQKANLQMLPPKARAGTFTVKQQGAAAAASVARQASAASSSSQDTVQLARAHAQHIQQQMHGLKTRLEVAVQHNAALEPDLQLSSDELCLNSELRDTLLQQGKSRTDTLRQQLLEQQRQNDVLASKLRAACWDATAVPDAVITAVGPTCLALGLGELEAAPEQTAKLALHKVCAVHNMQIIRASPAETALLEEVQMLRATELQQLRLQHTSQAASHSSARASFQLDSAQSQTLSATDVMGKMQSTLGTIDSQPSLLSSSRTPETAKSNATSMPSSADPALPVRYLDLTSSHVDNDRGRSGLLYTPVELTTKERHDAQAVLLQHEAQLIKILFNRKFQAAQAAKADLIVLVEEKSARVASIELELGLSSSARAAPSSLEDSPPERVLVVLDSEVNIGRWVDPKMQQQHQAELEAAAASAAAFQQGTALRGVQEMLQGKPGQVQSAGQAQAVPLELARQPWMDLPDWQHTPQQRAALKEHDQKLQAWLQKQERHHAALETELRSLKFAIGAACFAFDDSLISLQQQRDAAEACLCMTQMHRAAVIASNEHQQDLQMQRETATQQLKKTTQELIGRRQMVADVIQALDKAQTHLDSVQPQGRAIDKAFKHELGPLSCYSDLLAMYQDRLRGITYQADFQMAELAQLLARPPAVSTLPQIAAAPSLSTELGSRSLSLASRASMSRPTGTSRLKPEGQAPASALTQLRALGPLGIAPTKTDGVSGDDAKQQEDPFESALVQQAFADTPVTSLDPSTGTELPLGPADMPRGCKPEQWTRAVALRDARASIEHDTVQLTNWVQLLSDQLLVLQQEEQHLTASQKAAEQAEAGINAELSKQEGGVHVQLRLKMGQVEAVDDSALASLSDMMLLPRQDVEAVNKLILAEGQARLAQQKALWQAQRHSSTAEWDHHYLQMQIQNQQALLQDLHLLHLPHGSPFGQSGEVSGPAKKETTAATVRRHQARQQRALADVYERNLKLECLVAQQDQENKGLASELQHLLQEAAALTEIYTPLKARQGESKRHLVAAMRQAHSIHVLKELAHQQQVNIGLMKTEIAHLTQRTRASFANSRPVQPDSIYS